MSLVVCNECDYEREVGDARKGGWTNIERYVIMYRRGQGVDHWGVPWKYNGDCPDCKRQQEQQEFDF